MKKPLKFLILSILFSCAESDNKYVGDEKRAIALNNKAMEIFTQSIFSTNESSENDLDLSLAYLDSAISIDDNYFKAYMNKARVYSELEEFEKAILTLDEGLRIMPNSNEALLFQGNLYDKIGNYDLARAKYESSLKNFSTILKTDSNSNAFYSKMHLLVLLGQKDSVNKYLESLIVNDPENEELINFRRSILEFDKEQYIDDI